MTTRYEYIVDLIRSLWILCASYHSKDFYLDQKVKSQLEVEVVEAIEDVEASGEEIEEVVEASEEEIEEDSEVASEAGTEAASEAGTEEASVEAVEVSEEEDLNTYK